MWKYYDSWEDYKKAFHENGMLIIIEAVIYIIAGDNTFGIFYAAKQPCTECIQVRADIPFEPVKSEIDNDAIYQAIVSCMENTQIGDISNVMTKNYNNPDTDMEFKTGFSLLNRIDGLNFFSVSFHAYFLLPVCLWI